MTQPSTLPDKADLELFKFYRSEIRYQGTVLANRVNTLISAQSFLLIAYATTLSGLLKNWQSPLTALLPPALATIGVFLSLQARSGIEAALSVLDEWRCRQRNLVQQAPELKRYDVLAYADRPDDQEPVEGIKRFTAGARFSKHAPAMFLVLWSYLLILPFVMYLYG